MIKSIGNKDRFPIYRLSKTLSFFKVSRKLKMHPGYLIYVFISNVHDEFTDVETSLGTSPYTTIQRYWSSVGGKAYVVDVLSKLLKCSADEKSVQLAMEAFSDAADKPDAWYTLSDTDYDIFDDIDTQIISFYEKTPVIQVVK